MHVTFVFDGLQFGGIERVGVEYIKLLYRNGYGVNIVNLKPKLNAMEKELPKDIKIFHIPYPRAITSQRYSKLKRYGIIGKCVCYLGTVFLEIFQTIYKFFYGNKLPGPDIAIAFSGHFNDLAFVSKNFAQSRKIAWLHGSETSYCELSPGFPELYGKIKNLVCLLNKDDEKITAFNRKKGINKIRIYNPVNLADRIVDDCLVGNLKSAYGDFVLMVGRLAKDKDQATLIHSIKILREKYSLKKNLLLVGDGSEKSRLEQLAKDQGLDKQVVFAGARYDVQNFYKAATVYAHASPAEGLPTVLLEAMFYGLPIASTNSEPGVKEILGDDCGLVTPVGDAEALAYSLYRLYTDGQKRTEIIKNGKLRILDFTPERIILRLEDYMGKLPQE